MKSSSAHNLLHQLAIVTVTYNPDPALLSSQYSRLPEEAIKILVDNGSRNQSELDAIRKKTPNTELILNQENTGLAAALNQGTWAALKTRPETRFILWLDQDSVPEPGSIESLLEGFTRLEEMGKHPGIAGPLLRDNYSGMSHGFHRLKLGRWKRIHPPAGQKSPVSCSSINGSGTLVRADLYRVLGGLDESLFIDHVDTEWSFRVLNSGYTLWGIPSAIFDHRMGEASIRFWFLGWRVWPARSPDRHYFLYRNSMRLLRRSYIPAAWKFWCVIKLVASYIVFSIKDSQGKLQRSCMHKGIAEGIRAGK